jgi:hypothetical protein
MLLYITAEDVFGDDGPQHKGPRPLHRIPETVAGLFDLGLRHHVRKAAMAWPGSEGFEQVPDWKLDRLAIRVALYVRERCGVEPGDRVAVLGRLSWLWPVVDFAAMGFGSVPVGLEHDLSDDVVADVVTEAQPRLLFVTDPESTERATRLRSAGRLGDTTIVAEGLPEEDGLLPLEKLQDLGAVLDTAERAQGFRAVSRQIAAEGAALWHVAAAGDLSRLSHRDAMALIEPRLRERPAQEGDIAYVEGPRASLNARLALASFVGDGLTTTALGHGTRADKDIAELRPHKMVVSNDWVDSACRGQGPRWPVGLDRPWARRRLLERLGGRIRWIETASPLDGETLRALDAAGVGASTGPERSGPKTNTVH